MSTSAGGYVVVLVLLSLSGLSCQAWRHFPLHSSPSPSSSSSSSSFSSMSPSSSSLSLAKITSDLLNLPTIDPKISPKYTNIPSLLNTLKIKGTIRKWGSTNLDYRSISESELFQVTRTSFSTKDLLNDILQATEVPTPIDGKTIVNSFLSVVLSSVIIPQLPIPLFYQSIFISATIVLPFILLLLSVIFPEIFVILRRGNNTKAELEVEQDRILYHEAGHFLVGYLCGVFIQAYDVSGEKDAGTSIFLEDGTTLKAKSAHLMVTAMAGVVAETLRFGDCKGGIEDIPVVYEIMRIEKIKSMKDKKGVLRWALLKALTLLKIYRDELDDVAWGMKNGVDVNELILDIENCPSPNSNSPSITSC